MEESKKGGNERWEFVEGGKLAEEICAEGEERREGKEKGANRRD